MPTHICRARLSGRFAHIQNWGDRFAGITIFASIIANIGGPDEAPRNFPSWSTLLLKIYCDVASDVGVNSKNVGVLSIESSLFHLFHYTFLQTKHQRKGY